MSGNTTTLADLVDLPLHGGDAYDFMIGKGKSLGYVDKMSFKGSGSSCVLTPDVVIKDPENPDSDLKVVAVLDNTIHWEGGPTKPISITGRISRKNQSALGTCVTSLTGGSDVEISWVVVCYDTESKKYFKRFHTDGKEVKLVITKGTKVEISEEANEDVKEPVNYTFSMSLTAKGEAGKQELQSARSPDLKVSRPLGGIGA